jgi:probable rRNA maturation factor
MTRARGTASQATNPYPRPVRGGGRGRGVRVELRRHARIWAPSKAAIATWTEAALGARAAGREIAVSVVGPAASRKLNAQYRGRNHATNVLSFPAAPMPGAPLGDLVICPQVLRADAQEQKKSLRAHWAHLVVHGALHLVGYDHERDDDARRMERREIAVLRRLGFPNPYRPGSR